ncbi:hypothetical protein [Photobacterium sp. GSS17]|uniref:hypothetical protein n=1 Tax=Photobacterium sp. GSS17 TaxID=3020715 RepID=UPI0023600039|nr:hypothetical protein [Photobacterium sp. GSS17]
MRLLASIVLAMSLMGCSVRMVPISEATPVPQEDIFAAELLTPDASRTEKVTLVRDEHWSGSANSFRLFLEGRKVAEIDVGEKLELYLAKDKTYFGHLEAVLFTDSLPTTEFELKASETMPNNYRLSIVGDTITINRSALL